MGGLGLFDGWGAVVERVGMGADCDVVLSEAELAEEVAEAWRFFGGTRDAAAVCAATELYRRGAVLAVYEATIGTISPDGPVMPALGGEIDGEHAVMRRYRGELVGGCTCTPAGNGGAICVHQAALLLAAIIRTTQIERQLAERRASGETRQQRRAAARAAARRQRATSGVRS